MLIYSNMFELEILTGYPTIERTTTQDDKKVRPQKKSTTKIKRRKYHN